MGAAAAAAAEAAADRGADAPPMPWNFCARSRRHARRTRLPHVRDRLTAGAPHGRISGMFLVSKDGERVLRYGASRTPQSIRSDVEAFLLAAK